MANLALPVLASEAPGNFVTSALWNANVYNGLTFAQNPPVFVGYQSSAQSIANNTLTPIALDTENVDSYGGHSTTTNTSRYVAQQSGLYLLVGAVSFATNTSGTRVSQLAKNGTAITSGYFSAASSSFTTSTTAITIVNLAATDYVEVWGNQGSGGALSTVANDSSMVVLWVHA